MMLFDFRLFFRLTVATATLASGPVLAAGSWTDKLAARITVFDGATPRESEIKLRPDPKMTVFTPEGRREIPFDTPWPTSSTKSGWLAIAAGYRRDNMRFNIGGKGYPNILSELEWQTPATQIRADGGWTHASGATLKGHLAIAHTFAKGENRDSDYALDNRQAEFSRSHADTTGSEMLDASLGAGWTLRLGSAATLTPLIGLARYESIYRSSNGRQVLSDAAAASLLGIAWNVPLGPFDGLHSRYHPIWSSIWLGLDGELKAGQRVSLRGSLKHHWFTYKAEADWNLRSDLAHPLSFVHKDSGKGWEAEVGAAIALDKGHQLSIDLSKRSMKTQQGKDTTFFYNGASSTIDLGEAVLGSWSISLAYRYEF